MSATKDLLERLRRHYIKPGDFPGGIFLDECGVNGGGAGQRVDALHVGFTSASGRMLTGHELKVSRSDWLNELNKPGKADFWADQCHAWYLVTSDPDIVHEGELPPGWGHMVPGPSKTRMKVLVKAEVHRDREPSWLVVRSVFARLDTLQHRRLTKERQEREDLVRREVERRVKERLSQTTGLTEEQSDRIAVVEKLEETFGVRIDKWRYNEEGHVVRPEVFAEALKLALQRVPTLPEYRLLELERAVEHFRKHSQAAADWAKAMGS